MHLEISISVTYKDIPKLHFHKIPFYFNLINYQLVGLPMLMNQEPPGVRAGAQQHYFRTHLPSIHCAAEK